MLNLFYRLRAKLTFCKVDWTAAYKHVAVRPEDLILQFVEIGQSSQADKQTQQKEGRLRNETFSSTAHWLFSS